MLINFILDHILSHYTNVECLIITILVIFNVSVMQLKIKRNIFFCCHLQNINTTGFLTTQEKLYSADVTFPGKEKEL